jgi:hypothetical protein
MSYHQQPHELRLAISSEAEALISDFGGEAHAEASGAPEKQAMIPWPGTGALSRRRSPAGQADAHPCSPDFSLSIDIARA